MKGAFRVFFADLAAIMASYQAIALVLLLPSVLLVLVGQLRTRTEIYSLHVAGTVPDDSATAADRLEESVRLWQQVSSLNVTREPEAADNPLQTIRERGLDLLLNVGDAGSRCWRIYTAETKPSRAVVLQNIASGLERGLLLIATRQERGNDTFCPEEDPEPESAAPAGTASEENHELEDLSASLVGLGVFPPATLFGYQPGALDRGQALFPMTIALMVCFLPFVIAAPGLVREKDNYTLEVLLSAPSINGASLFFGKSLLPVVLTLFNLLLMLGVVDIAFGLHVKSGIVLTLLLMLPALVSSALLGLVVSTVATSQTQAVMASAVYFFCLTLLTGFVTPLAEASPLVLAMSRFLPLSFVLPILEGWFFGAEAARSTVSVAYLLLQLAMFGAIAAFAFRRFMRSL